jgi:hypothetical protein
MMMRTLMVVALALAACEQGSAKVSEADCGTAVDALARRAAPDKQAAAKASLAKGCVDDHWTREAVTCLAKAADKDAEKACRYHHLTQEQTEKHERLAGELLSNVAAVMAKMSAFKDQMCACKDNACAKRVSDDMTTWSMQVTKEMNEPPKMTEADQKRATEIGTAMGECMQKAMGMGDDPTTKQPEPAEGAKAMAAMASFKDQMCACKDADCAKRVSQDMTAWSQKQASAQIEPVRMSEADQKRATEIGTQMGECMQAAMTP